MAQRIEGVVGSRGGRCAAGLVVCLALAGCGGGSPSGPSGRWIGQVVPQAPSDVCVTTTGVLSFRGSQFQFEPNQGVVVVTGTVGPGGALRGEVDLSGSGHAVFREVFEGQVAADAVTGTLITPRCRSTVSLKPAPERGIFEDLFRR